jgi:hypothetical protein
MGDLTKKTERLATPEQRAVIVELQEQLRKGINLDQYLYSSIISASVALLPGLRIFTPFSLSVYHLLFESLLKNSDEWKMEKEDFTSLFNMALTIALASITITPLIARYLPKLGLVNIKVEENAFVDAQDEKLTHQKALKEIHELTFILKGLPERHRDVEARMTLSPLTGAGVLSLVQQGGLVPAIQRFAYTNALSQIAGSSCFNMGSNFSNETGDTRIANLLKEQTGNALKVLNQNNAFFEWNVLREVHSAAMAPCLVQMTLLDRWGLNEEYKQQFYTMVKSTCANKLLTYIDHSPNVFAVQVMDFECLEIFKSMQVDLVKAAQDLLKRAEMSDRAKKSNQAKLQQINIVKPVLQKTDAEVAAERLAEEQKQAAYKAYAQAEKQRITDKKAETDREALIAAAKAQEKYQMEKKFGVGAGKRKKK